MNQKKLTNLVLGAAALLTASCSQPTGDNKGFTTELIGDSMVVVTVTEQARYLLLPITESNGEMRVRTNTAASRAPEAHDPADCWMDIRLAVGLDAIDYWTPMELKYGEDGIARVDVIIRNPNVSRRAPIRRPDFQKLFKLSDEFNVENTEYFRPRYHHTPMVGWMNDPNGMVYFNGEYHLYYQYNPYGSKWGNMHWGHSVSTDMMHWTPLTAAIERDNYGQIFSGSAIVARVSDEEKGTHPFKANKLVPGNGTEGDFIAAYYTSDNGTMPRPLQEQQSFAISTDNGRSYEKFGAPILKSDGRRDFRDPKLFHFDDSWYVIISADSCMQFFKSPNLRDWSYVSEFGLGYGVQPRQFECPDFFPLTMEDGTQKWVMIVNVNPGCFFGGSASEYFVGDFDGKNFVCDSHKKTVKWLDWGKDHYAAVTFANEPKDRIISIAWMSNWQYANDLPTQQFRSANALPRELFAFRQGKEIYVGQRPVEEVKEAMVLSEPSTEIGDNDGALLINMDIHEGCEFKLCNNEGEYTKFRVQNHRLYMDRTHSGAICNQAFISSLSSFLDTIDDANPRNEEFETWVPLDRLCGTKDVYHLEMFVDISSFELFVDGGKAVMTNLVFPYEPYNSIEGTGYENLKVQKIALK